jgi:hypothetical protein
MKYEVKQTERFKRHMRTLDSRLGLTKEEEGKYAICN